jgi:hypothetical protein
MISRLASMPDVHLAALAKEVFLQSLRSARTGDNVYERLNLAALSFLATFIVIAFFGRVLADPDAWWHLGSGRLIAAEYLIPAADPFSHSMRGAPWHAHEWGAEVIMWSAYKAGGWSGLTALFAAAAGAASAILAYFVQRHLSAAAASGAVFAALFCLLPSAWARPHLLVLPMFVYWVACLLRAAEENRAPSLWLAPVMAVWANMHGSFLLGIAMMGVIGCESVWRSPDRRTAAVGWGLFGTAAIGASLLTPFGISGYTYPLYVSSMTALGGINEWAYSTPSNSPIFFGVLLAGLSVLLLTGARFPPVRAALFVGLLFLALKHNRHIFVFAYLSTLLAAEPLGRALSRKERTDRVASGIDRSMFLVLIVVAIGAVLVRLAVPVDPGVRNDHPLKAIASVPADVRRLPVFNHYDYGGPLIFYGVHPFIDGRADMYGDNFFEEYSAAVGGDRAAWKRIEQTYRIRWTILPRNSALIPILQQDHWRLVHADSKVAVHVRIRN